MRVQTSRSSSTVQAVPTISVEVDDQSALFLRFRISQLPQALSNALRRVMLAEIPTLAIDLVEISENSSPLFDEMIAHRIGLVPLLSSAADDFQYGRDCTCASSCPNCTVYYQLDVSATTGGPPVGVNSRDLVPVTPNSPPAVDAEIPLTKISGNQSVRLTATGKKGVGKMHAKFMCANVAMWYRPVVTINRDVEMGVGVGVRQAIVKACPRAVFALDELDHLILDKLDQCIVCGECLKVGGVEGSSSDQRLISIREDEEVSEWEVETNGARSVADVVITAAKILKNKFLTLAADLDDWEKEHL